MQVEKLPFWRTVAATYAFTFGHLGTLLRIGWPWLLVLTAAVTIFSWFHWPSFHAATASGSYSWWDMATYPLSLLVGSSIAVSWHRFILLGDTPQSAVSLRLERPVFCYFAWSLIMAFCFLAPIMLCTEAVLHLADQSTCCPVEVDGPDLPAAPSPAAVEEQAGELDLSFGDAITSKFGLIMLAVIVAVGLPIVALLSYVPVRLSLLLPGIAIGVPATQAAWRRSRGSFWRLFWGTILTAMVPALLVAACFQMEPATRAQYITHSTLLELTSLLIGMFGVTFLSLAYRHLARLGTIHGADAKL